MDLRRMVMWAALAAGMAAGSVRDGQAQPRLFQPPKTSDPQQLGPERKRDRGGDDVPPAYRPPPGMCRIWLDNVAPAQQPAATDCNSAVRNRPANARVLFGDDYAKGRDSAASRDHVLRPGGTATPTFTLTAAERRVRRSRARRAAGAARPHGPAAEDVWEETDDPVAADTTLRGVPRTAGQPPAVRAPARAPGEPDDVDDGRPADDWEAGYAAGYRDAMRGRRPRVRGMDRQAERTQGGERAAPSGIGVGIGTGGADGGPVIVVPPGTAEVDPRYFNTGRYPPPGRANGTCLDRDGDGWCDDPRFGAPVCRDLDGDGRCDDYPALAAAPFPATLPAMRAGTDVLRGQGSQTALRWLGTTEVIARVSSAGRSGAPSRVTWLDANTGALLQVWSDRDGDGVADRVEVYRNGRRVKLLGR